MSGRVLITGAAGGIGTFLRAGMPELGWKLRMLDQHRIADVTDDEEAIVADINDPKALDEACSGVDAIIHLAGVSSENQFQDILRANIEGTYQVFEAARRNSVPRVVFASSNHAVGYYPSGEPARTDGPCRPDTYYGVSKVFGEAIGSLYADKCGVQVVSVRIGSCFERPRDRRQLATWLSPGDAVRLFDACLTAPDVHYSTIYGVSANTRASWDLTSARALGYTPLDNAETFAESLPTEEPDSLDLPHIGGAYITLPLGG